MQNATNGNVHTNGQPTVVRTSRGLTIGGSRLTLYDIMDCLRGGWPLAEIREVYSLTEQQMTDILTYLREHHAEVEVEYQQVLEYAAELRRRTEAELALRPLPPAPPRTPEEAAIRAKLAEHRKARRGQP